MLSAFLILPKEDLISSKPISSTSIPTISAAIYSNLPWPKGWSLSACLFAILKPAIVIIEDAASARLLIASAVIEMLCATVPIKSLATDRSMFSAIPTAPLSMPYFSRTAGFLTLLPSLMKSLMSRDVIIHRSVVNNVYVELIEGDFNAFFIKCELNLFFKLKEKIPILVCIAPNSCNKTDAACFV